MLAATAERYGFPRPDCVERAKSTERKPEFGLVKGRFGESELVERPPHPDLLPARGEKERAEFVARQN